jgi:hypothetical protein
MGKVYDFEVETPAAQTVQVTAAGPRQAVAKALKELGIQGSVQVPNHRDRTEPRWRARAEVVTGVVPEWLFVVVPS